MAKGKTTPAGGRIMPLDVGALIRDMIKYGLAVTPIPGMDEDDPIEPFVSDNIDTTLENLAVDFTIPMRDVDGQLHPVSIPIRSLKDFEEDSLVEDVELLRELQEDIDFLEHFQKELKNDKALQAEVDELITAEKGTNLSRFLVLLENWIDDLSREESRFIALTNQ